MLYGDPYVEWNEEISARENYEEEADMFDVEELKTIVVNRLITVHDMTDEEATELVETSYREEPDVWNENASVGSLANALAEDDDE